MMAADTDQRPISKRVGILKAIGTGVITGAADDDPSAIGTYASAGAKFGLAFLWIAPVVLPMMYVVVYLSAKLGRVYGKGLFAVIRDRYPRWLLYPTMIGAVVGNLIEAAANLGGIGASLNLLIPIPIPGVGVVTLGIGGGPLIVALILGKLRRTGPMLWTMPLPANIVLRNFGLAIFLATVGVNAGQPFVRTVAESGFTMLFIGVAVLLTTVAIVLLIGHYLMRIPYDDLVGVASGATGNPAILVYSTKMAPTDRPDIGYAMIFPSMTLVKVIAAQIVGLLTVGNAG